MCSLNRRHASCKAGRFLQADRNLRRFPCGKFDFPGFPIITPSSIGKSCAMFIRSYHTRTIATSRGVFDKFTSQVFRQWMVHSVISAAVPMGKAATLQQVSGILNSISISMCFRSYGSVIKIIYVIETTSLLINYQESMNDPFDYCYLGDNADQNYIIHVSMCFSLHIYEFRHFCIYLAFLIT